MVDHTVYPCCGTCVHWLFDRQEPSTKCMKHRVYLSGQGQLICKQYSERPSAGKYIAKNVRKQSAAETMKLRDDYMYRVEWVFGNEPLRAIEAFPISNLKSF